MGKFGPRLNSRRNAKRWPKGQSSSSNPETKTHREQVSWIAYKDSTVKPGLKKEDLEKHDAIQGIQPNFAKLELDDDKLETNTENTIDTFATNYSNCSNVSFSGFLNNFQSNSLLHKEMLAVLSAVTEVIKQKDGTESSTEYFAALMSTLEAIEDDTSVAATLSLLGMGLKTVPTNVLMAQFGPASKIFLQILAKHVSSEKNFLVLRHGIHCLSLLLRAQEPMVWTNSSTMQTLDAILSFATHSKPKVRKTAQHGIYGILKGSGTIKSDDGNPSLYHPASPHIGKFCITQLSLGSEPGGVTSILHVLTLLKDILHLLPEAQIKTICESLLKLMTLKNMLITSCCLQVFHGLFVSRPLENALPAQRNAQIITALYDYQPPVIDVQPTLAWLTVMQEAHLNLANISLNTCAAILPKLLSKCMELWLSDRTEVVSGTSNTIKILLQDCIGKMCENDETMFMYKTTIDQITFMMHQALNCQYLEAWYHILHLIALLFQIAGKSQSPNFLEILKTLAILRDSYNFSSKNDAEYAVGAAIRVLGPEKVLKFIPLKKSENAINLERTWLLPLLKDCVIGGSLSLFSDTLLPLATLCEEKSKEPVGGKPYEFLVSQIWAILPSICTNASDVKDNFKNLAKLLGTTFSEKKDLRLSIMSALRKLITKAVEDNNIEDINELAKFAKNYLPLFLNLYTTKPNGTDEEGQRLAVFETIKIYLKITNKKLVEELFDRALSKLNESDADEFFKESIHDVVRLLIEYTDADRLKTFYDICIPALKESSKIKEQKKAYRFLEEIYSSENEICKTFIAQHRREIQKLLISSATEVATPSRGARLRCLIHLIKSHPKLEKTKFLEAIVPEAVVYLKDLNTKCRTSAYRLLNVIAEKFLENAEHLTDYINMLLVGLGGSHKYCSASLLALASVTYHYNGSLGVETVKDILDHACKLAASPTRGIAEAALSYIKVYISIMPSPIVASSLPTMMDALCTMSDDCHRHFRQKVRDILAKLLRKYGIKPISDMIPASNVMLHKRLKNINKIEETKKKKNESKKSKDQDNDEDHEFNAKRRPKTMEEILADSEDEFESTENENPTRNRRRTRKETWIEEDEEIVDLIDPVAARNITTTLPGISNSKTTIVKPKDRGFKTAPDGRLIITVDNEKGDETEEITVRKKKSPLLLHSDSEDDYEAEDDEIQSVHSTGRKRKLSENFDSTSVVSGSTSRYQAGGSGIHRPLKKAKTVHIPGSEYKAPKAGGDIKRKGKPDPYAYIPISRASLNKRKRKKNESKFHGIIKGAKKGAKAGRKNKRN